MVECVRRVGKIPARSCGQRGVTTHRSHTSEW
jgi:hypothetical protein